MPGTLVFQPRQQLPRRLLRGLLSPGACRLAVEALDRQGHDPRYPVRQELAACAGRSTSSNATCSPGMALWWLGHSLSGLLSLLVACRRPELVHLVHSTRPSSLAGVRQLPGASSPACPPRCSPGSHRSQAPPSWPQHGGRATSISAAADVCPLGPASAGRLPGLAASSRARRRGAPALRARGGEPHLRHAAGLCAAPAEALPAAMRHRLLWWHPVSRGCARPATGQPRLVGERFHWVEGGHLFPFEKPDETAARVLAARGPRASLNTIKFPPQRP